MLEFLISTVVGVVLVTAIVVLLFRRNKSSQKDTERLRLAVAEGQIVPLSLHPVIDPTICVGSFSCIKACPEGEIIGVVDGVATLVEAAHCIGHARCAVECPVGAIKLVFGTAERGIDLPQADESFESSRAGVYIVGELGGMGLIKNALRQGLVLGKTLKTKLKKSQATETLTDVVVIGGGPAGIACAVGCREAGLDVRILEQDTLGGAIAHYPRGKVVMSEQIVMPGYGAFGRSLLSKEELLDELRTLVSANKIVLEEGQKVVGIQGDAPFLSVRTSTDATVQCRAVVLAIGLRGTPRKLGVPGEDLAKVLYRLVEPEQYHGKRVLVVGGGDSAVEAAIQLAEESTAKVTISYRQGGFARCKQRNKDKIQRLIDEGRVKALFKTRVLSIESGLVRLAPALDEAEEKKQADEKRRADELAALEEPDVTDPLGRGNPDTTDPLAVRPGLEQKKGYDKRGITGSFRAKPLPAPDAEAPSAEAAPVLREPTGKSAKKGYDKSSITGSFRAVPVDPAGAAMPEGRIKAGPTGSFRSVVPGDVERDTRPARSKTSTKSAPVNVGPGGRARTLDGLRGSSMSGSVKLEREEMRLKNDSVIISVGGQLPTEFLNSIGVGTRRYHGEEKSGVGARPGVRGTTKAEVEARSRRRLAMSLFCLGVAIIVALILIGQEYYWLPYEQRAASPLHSLLKPSGLWGHGVGVGATTFMIANFLYALRKRWRKLKGTASIRTWLTFHMFVGIMGPLVIGFHAAFLVNNLLAVWTWAALSVVVGTGIFGRFLFGFVPAQAGKMLGISELREQVSDMTKTLQPHMAESADFGRVTGIFTRATEAPVERTLVGAVVRDSKGRKQLERSIDEARHLFKDEAKFYLYKESLQKIGRMKMQIAFHTALKRVFRGWLVIHVVVAIFMVVLIGAHVGVTTYLGFRWIFSDGL